MVTRFQRRFFVLNPDVLSYYKRKNGSILEKGQISLKLAKMSTHTLNDKTLTINTGITEIYLQFASVEEKKEWYNAILETKKKLKQKVQKEAQDTLNNCPGDDILGGGAGGGADSGAGGYLDLSSTPKAVM